MLAARRPCGPSSPSPPAGVLALRGTIRGRGKGAAAGLPRVEADHPIIILPYCTIDHRGASRRCRSPSAKRCYACRVSRRSSGSKGGHARNDIDTGVPVAALSYSRTARPGFGAPSNGYLVGSYQIPIGDGPPRPRCLGRRANGMHAVLWRPPRLWRSRCCLTHVGGSAD